MPDWLWVSLAIVLIIEGAGPLLMPNRWQRYLTQLAQTNPNQIRRIGGALVITGLICLYFTAM
ncbi:DUF2065 domain-containing protein [Alteromonas gilva]|uniref:DUF2065 domain-containing protein n=1 Tax=Alteromonas gilva TaxID=2987522 RepID=A0ABT5L559_9ALTE|nr:DUF2065 domain-containing protein [Alteromonas gilva]MDC8832185.1 DUF2065 domain-containing protein [Alteromonas gilva]